jgi:hypothetical protein
MTSKLTTLLAAAAMLSGLAAMPPVFAEEAHPSSQPPSAQGMMGGDHGGMMNMMEQMSPDHMKQMTRMVDNCNRMMEGMSNAPTEPHNQPPPDTHK